MNRTFNKTAAVALALTGMVSATAAAASDAPVTMSTSAPNTCAIMASPTVVQSAGATITAPSITPGASGGTTVVNWGASLVDAVTARPAWTDYNGSNTGAGNTTIQVNFPAQCNYANSTISVRSVNGGMRRAGGRGAAEGSFADAIAYHLRVGRSSLNASTDNTVEGDYRSPNETKTRTVSTPWNGTLAVRIRAQNTFSTLAPNTSLAQTVPLLAGTYSDTIQLRLGATF